MIQHIVLLDKNSLGGRDLIVGDVHGSIAFKMLLDTVGPNDRLFLVGDLLDRGSDSSKIIEFIQEKNKERDQPIVQAVKGNHEALFLDAMAFLFLDYPSYHVNRMEGYGENTPASSLILFLINGGSWIYNDKEVQDKISEFINVSNPFYDLDRICVFLRFLEKNAKKLLPKAQLEKIKVYVENLPYVIFVGEKNSSNSFVICHADMPLTDEQLVEKAERSLELTKTDIHYIIWARQNKRPFIIDEKQHPRNDASTVVYCGHNAMQEEISIECTIRRKTNTVNLDFLAYATKRFIVVDHTNKKTFIVSMAQRVSTLLENRISNVISAYLIIKSKQLDKSIEKKLLWLVIDFFSRIKTDACSKIIEDTLQKIISGSITDLMQLSQNIFAFDNEFKNALASGRKDFKEAFFLFSDFTFLGDQLLNCQFFDSNSHAFFLTPADFFGTTIKDECFFSEADFKNRDQLLEKIFPHGYFSVDSKPIRAYLEDIDCATHNPGISSDEQVRAITENCQLEFYKKVDKTHFVYQQEKQWQIAYTEYRSLNISILNIDSLVTSHQFKNIICKLSEKNCKRMFLRATYCIQFLINYRTQFFQVQIFKKNYETLSVRILDSGDNRSEAIDVLSNINDWLISCNKSIASLLKIKYLKFMLGDIVCTGVQKSTEKNYSLIYAIAGMCATTEALMNEEYAIDEKKTDDHVQAEHRLVKKKGFYLQRNCRFYRRDNEQDKKITLMLLLEKIEAMANENKVDFINSVQTALGDYQKQFFSFSLFHKEGNAYIDKIVQIFSTLSSQDEKLRIAKVVVIKILKEGLFSHDAQLLVVNSRIQLLLKAFGLSVNKNALISFDSIQYTKPITPQLQ